MSDSPLTFQELLVQRIVAELGTPRTSESGRYVDNLVCPDCGRAEAYTFRDDPRTIRCNRRKRCGASIITRELFPDVAREIETRFPATKDVPLAPATAYLRLRGLDKALEGHAYRYLPRARGLESGAVMHVLDADTMTGSILDPPTGQGKSHTIGPIAGKIWTHHALEYDKTKPIYVTEGIIDALSLIEIGRQAIAVLGAGADPRKIDTEGWQHVVLAFDADNAGRDAAKRWHKHLESQENVVVQVIEPVGAKDWNDLLERHGAEDFARWFEDHDAEMGARGQMALSESAETYAQRFLEHYQHAPGLFDFDGRMYYATAREETRDKQRVKTAVTTMVGDFTFSVNHFQLDRSNAEEPEHKFALEIHKYKGGSISFVAGAQDLNTATALRTTILRRGGAYWKAEQNASDAFLKRVLRTKAKTVRQIQHVGYDAESSGYIFRDFAIDRNGLVVPVDASGFLNLGVRATVRPPQYRTLKPEQGVAAKEILTLIWGAWGPRGIVAVSWLLASWFVHEIRPSIGFFPFMSLHGETQCGKSRLVRALNAMQGIDEEGLPLSRNNTTKGEMRKLSQFSSLAKAVLEANRADKGRFDLDNILTLYNDGNAIQITAQKSMDITTREVPFLGSILFVQNNEPFTSKAQRERVVSVKFEQAMLNDDTKAAFTKLVSIPARKLAQFFVEVMKERRFISDSWSQEHEICKAKVLPHCADNRLNETYALILAFSNILQTVIDTQFDVDSYLCRLAKEKYAQISENGNMIADLIFDALLHLQHDEMKEPFYFPDKDNNELCVRMKDMLRNLTDAGYKSWSSVKDVEEALKAHDAFVSAGVRKRFSKTDRTQSRAWVFDLQKVYDTYAPNEE